MREFKIRASQVGKIMAYPDKDKLPQGAKTYCNEWVISHLYNRSKLIYSKYMKKGNINENESISMLSNYLNQKFSKNEESFENDYMTGTPDVINGKTIIDIKNSWDCFTFPFLDNELKNKDYYWQLQGYMSLTGAEKGVIAYTLTDLEDDEVEKEAWKEVKNRGLEELDIEIYDEIKEHYTYSNLPNNMRIRLFHVKRDDKAISQVNNRVKLCSDYIEELKNEFAFEL